MNTYHQARDVEVLHLGPSSPQIVHGSWSGPPIMLFDRLFPCVVRVPGLRPQVATGSRLLWSRGVQTQADVVPLALPSEASNCCISLRASASSRSSGSRSVLVDAMRSRATASCRAKRLLMIEWHLGRHRCGDSGSGSGRSGHGPPRSPGADSQLARHRSSRKTTACLSRYRLPHPGSASIGRPQEPLA
jgi:hypothetical protein